MPNRRITAAELAAIAKPKRSKYGVRTDEAGKAARTYNGALYHSKREAQFAAELDIQAMVGQIAGYRRQVPYELVVNGTQICRYVADFVVTKDGLESVIDVKGVETEAFRLKKRLMLACHGIEVEVVR